MRRDPYRDFAQIYNEWQGLYPRPFSIALAPRIQSTVRIHGSPNRILADTACGTGLFAFWWSRTHPSWSTYGVDRSAAMIQVARRSARSKAPKDSEAQSTRSGAMPRSAQSARSGVMPRSAQVGHVMVPVAQDSGRSRSSAPVFLVQDLLALRLPEPAGVITCLFDSLNHVIRQWDLLRIFRRVRAALAPGGLFIFDLVDDLDFPEFFTGSSIMKGPNLYLGMETVYGEVRGVGLGEARFTFFRRSGVRWRRIEFEIQERRWFRGEIRDLLAGADLELVRLDRIDPYESKYFVVPRTYWICRRPRSGPAA